MLEAKAATLKEAGINPVAWSNFTAEQQYNLHEVNKPNEVVDKQDGQVADTAAAGGTDAELNQADSIKPASPAMTENITDSANKVEQQKLNQSTVNKGSQKSSANNEKGNVALDRLLELSGDKTRGNDAYHIYRAVGDSEANTLKEKTNVDAHGFLHGIDEGAVRHILERHGDEKDAGLSVTLDDIKNIHEITDAGKADSVEYGGKTKKGLDKIVYKKRVNGHTVVVEDVRTGRKRLSAVTMYKVRAGQSETSKEAVPQTSETLSTQPVVNDNKSIAASSEKATDINDLHDQLDKEIDDLSADNLPLVAMWKKPLAAHDAPQHESSAETSETVGKQASSSNGSITQDGEKASEQPAAVKPDNVNGVRVLDNSDVLDLLGYGDYELVLAEKHAVIDGMFNHGLTADDWKNLPEWLQNPIAVFKRDDGHMTFIAPELKNGNPVVIGVSPKVGGQGNRGKLLHVVLTAYEKDSGKLPIARMIREGHLVYLNTRKSLAFNRSSGLQLPSSADEFRGSKQKVYFDRDLVKYRKQREQGSFSQSTNAAKNPHTESSLFNSLRDRMDKEYGEGWTNRLLATGKFKIVSKTDAVNIAGDAGQSAQGFYNPSDDTTYLVADNISKDTDLKGLMLHEIGVHALHLGKDDIEFKGILDQLRRLKAIDARVKAAFASVPKDTQSDVVNEEALGYLVEHHPDLPLVKKLLAWFRAKIRSLDKFLKGTERLKLMKWANELTADDLIYMAHSALRSAPDSLAFDQQGNQGVMASQSSKPLLAPNGKPSNLNAMQYEQVRTPEFKNWFGDWMYNPDREMTVIPLVDDPNMPINGDIKTLGRYLLDKYRNLSVTNRQTGDEISIYRVGLLSSLKNRKPLARRLYAILPTLLEQSAYAGYKENTKLDTKPNILGYEAFYAPVAIDGKVYSVKILVDRVKDDARGRGYYYHQIQDIALGDPVGSTRGLLDAKQGASPPELPSGRIILSQLTGERNNNASKVVDENGEPLVMYHGTPNAHFSVFDPTKSGTGGTFDSAILGMYFAKNKQYASGMAGPWFNRDGTENNPAMIPVFLNVRNPLESERATDFLTKDESINLKKKAIETGHDGVIDYYGHIALFNSNQIKSATGNTGAFSPDNNDIRFSIASPQDTFDDIADIQPSTPKQVFDRLLNAGEIKADKGRINLRKLGLSALTQRQLTEIGANVLPILKRFDAARNGYDVEESTWHNRADEIAKRWENLVAGNKYLNKTAEFENRKEQMRLSDLMHEMTATGIDPR